MDLINFIVIGKSAYRDLKVVTLLQWSVCIVPLQFQHFLFQSCSYDLLEVLKFKSFTIFFQRIYMFLVSLWDNTAHTAAM